MADRAAQALHLLGLDPLAESRADGHSYGFRRERRCADAMAQTHIVLSHPNKRGKWIRERYFQRDGHRHWVFTGTLRDQKGQGWPFQLMAAAKVKIIRYVKIRSDANPYDPKWELYLEARLGWQLTQTLAGRSRIKDLWKKQKGRCWVCGQPLRIAEEDCQIHHRIWRSRGGL